MVKEKTGRPALDPVWCEAVEVKAPERGIFPMPLYRTHRLVKAGLKKSCKNRRNQGKKKYVMKLIPIKQIVAGPPRLHWFK